MSKSLNELLRADEAFTWAEKNFTQYFLFKNEGIMEEERFYVIFAENQEICLRGKIYVVHLEVHILLTLPLMSFLFNNQSDFCDPLKELMTINHELKNKNVFF